MREVNADGTVIGTKGEYGSYLSTDNTFQNSTDGLLYYAIYDIEEDGNRYDALLTINTNYYTNAEELSEIKAINAPENIVAVESVQNTRALTQMYNLYLEEYARLAASETEPLISELDEDDIKAALNKKMVIELREIASSGDPSNTDKAKLKIFYEYYCDPTIQGCPEETSSVEMDPPLYNETVTVSLMKSIYLFFTKSSGEEQIDIRIDSSLEHILKSLDFYFIVQAGSDGSVPDCNVNLILSSYLAELGTIYSNARAVTKNAVNTVIKDPVTKSAKLRMMNVKVDIYRAGFLLDPDNLYATLESTK